MEGKQRFLYIGGFKLPDKNAAALRVMANAKALRELGHEVCFINYDPEEFISAEREVFYQGFKCFLEPKESLLSHLCGVKTVKRIIEQVKITAIIAYNYPSIALNRLISFCRRKQIRCFADVTEWYFYSKGIRNRWIKNADSSFRMKHVHFKMDGIIAISDYIYNYYQKTVKTIKIPPLVDIKEDKWLRDEKQYTDTLSLCYAGQPTKDKERLDLIVEAVDELPDSKKVSLSVIGITEQEYRQIYKKQIGSGRVRFLGRIPNTDVIRHTMNSDWSIVIRENNLAVKAGFPTKIVESISCGTPVIANSFSNISEYLDDTNSILISSLEETKKAIEKASSIRLAPNRFLFDYHKYLNSFSFLLQQSNKKDEQVLTAIQY